VFPAWADLSIFAAEALPLHALLHLTPGREKLRHSDAQNIILAQIPINGHDQSVMLAAMSCRSALWCFVDLSPINVIYSGVSMSIYFRDFQKKL
tara:strand:+ start:368 stop:649 length:282 start_codon:yes stop_codon:yes gene_type:complete